MSATSIFFNQSFDKKKLKAFIYWVLKTFGEKKSLAIIEELKSMGFYNATKAGLSIGLHDLKTPSNKKILISRAQIIMSKTDREFQGAELTATERSQRIIDTWHRTSEDLRKQVVDYFSTYDQLNSVYMMALSGARGNFSQVRQLIGMRGLMADPQGQIISFPIRSNLREGLTLTEYFISCSGARKGLVDTALRTADTGYLTRRLVDISHHIVVKKVTCYTSRGIALKALQTSQKILLPLKDRLVGRVLGEDIYSSSDQPEHSSATKPISHIYPQSEDKICNKSNTLIAKKNQEVSPDLALQISLAKLSKIKIPYKNPLLKTKFNEVFAQQASLRLALFAPKATLAKLDFAIPFVYTKTGLMWRGRELEQDLQHGNLIRRKFPTQRIFGAPLQHSSNTKGNLQKLRFIQSLSFRCKNEVFTSKRAVRSLHDAQDSKSFIKGAQLSYRGQDVGSKLLDKSYRIGSIALKLKGRLTRSLYVLPIKVKHDRESVDFMRAKLRFASHAKTKFLQRVQNEVLHDHDSLERTHNANLSSGGLRQVDSKQSCAQVLVRSPLTCAYTHEVCQLCYGWSMAQGSLVSLGEAVGVIAGQSIGEPGTQLTMRTFHTGGVFSGDLLQEIRAPHSGKIVFPKALQGLLIRTSQGRIAFLIKVSGELLLHTVHTRDAHNLSCLQKTEFFVSNGMQNEVLHVKRLQNKVLHAKTQQNQSSSNPDVQTTRLSLEPSTILFVRQGEEVKNNQLLAELAITTKEGNQPIKSRQTLFSEMSGKIVQWKSLLSKMHRTKAVSRGVNGGEDSPLFLLKHDYGTRNALFDCKTPFSKSEASENINDLTLKKIVQAKKHGFGYIEPPKALKLGLLSVIATRIGASEKRGGAVRAKLRFTSVASRKDALLAKRSFANPCKTKFCTRCKNEVFSLYVQNKVLQPMRAKRSFARKGFVPPRYRPLWACKQRNLSHLNTIAKEGDLVNENYSKM